MPRLLYHEKQCAARTLSPRSKSCNRVDHLLKHEKDGGGSLAGAWASTVPQLFVHFFTHTQKATMESAADCGAENKSDRRNWPQNADHILVHVHQRIVAQLNNPSTRSPHVICLLLRVNTKNNIMQKERGWWWHCVGWSESQWIRTAEECVR